MSYLTIEKSASAEQNIEKSKFIAYAERVSDREEAENFIASVREKHRDATHNVPAFIVGEKGETRWASDDGEPQGTSGIPVLNVIAGRKLTDVVVVVTRYFGGIKLGTGGLMRAYTGVAREALDRAGVCEITDMLSMRVRVSYPQFEKIKREVSKRGFEISDEMYDDMVTFNLTCGKDQEDEVVRMFSDLTQGRVNAGNIDIKKIKGMRKINA